MIIAWVRLRRTFHPGLTLGAHCKICIKCSDWVESLLGMLCMVAGRYEQYACGYQKERHGQGTDVQHRNLHGLSDGFTRTAGSILLAMSRSKGGEILILSSSPSCCGP